MSKQINYKGFGILHFTDRWPAYEVQFERIPGQYCDDWDGYGDYETLKAAKKAIDR